MAVKTIDGFENQKDEELDLNKEEEQDDKALENNDIDQAEVSEDATEKVRTPKPPFYKRIISDSQFQLDVLLGASVLQIVLTMLMYLIGSMRVRVWIIELAFCIGLVLFFHLTKGKTPKMHIIHRIMCISLLTLVVGVFTFITIFSFIQGSADFKATYLFTFPFAFLLVPAISFMLPAFVINAQSKKLFDKVLLIIISAISVVAVAFVCFFAMEHLILKVSYHPNIFGFEFDVNIDINNILTRILLLGCSVVMVVVSVLLKTEPRKNPVSKKY